MKLGRKEGRNDGSRKKEGKIEERKKELRRVDRKERKNE